MQLNYNDVLKLDIKKLSLDISLRYYCKVSHSEVAPVSISLREEPSGLPQKPLF